MNIQDVKKEDGIYYKNPLRRSVWMQLKGFTNIEDAIIFVKKNNYMGLDHIGLATYEQMKMNNTQWDNL
jgi:hypothetical protein